MELTKERLTEIVRAIDSEAYDESEIMGWFNSDDIMTMARQLLAGMEQEPVAYIDPFTFKNFATYRAGETDNKRMGREWVWANPDAGLIPLYSAPQLPQPAVVDNASREDFEAWARDAGFNEDWYFFTNVHPNHYDDDHINDMWAAWSACRAAMLHGAEPVSQPYTLPANSFTNKELEGMAHGDNPQANAYRELLAYRLSADGWIPCSERMPDTMISVLVTGDWFHHAVSFWDGASWCDLDFEPPVTHWMPLPAVPQQEEK